MQTIDLLTNTLAANSDEVQRLCNNFFKLTPFNHFDYQIYYDSGKVLSLSSNPDLLLSLYNIELLPTFKELSFGFVNAFTNPIMSPQIPLPPIFEENTHSRMHQNTLTANDVKVGIRVYDITRFKDSYRVCAFGSDKKDLSLLQYYLNAHKVMKNYIDYFEIKADSLIHSNRHKGMIYVPQHNPNNLNIQAIQPNDYYQINSALDYIRTEEFTEKFAILTQREISCLQLLAKGYSMKRIANKLGISPRTAETHFYNIKSKYKLQSKDQLVELWHSQLNPQYI